MIKPKQNSLYMYMCIYKHVKNEPIYKLNSHIKLTTVVKAISNLMWVNVSFVMMIQCRE